MKEAEREYRDVYWCGLSYGARPYVVIERHGYHSGEGRWHTREGGLIGCPATDAGLGFSREDAVASRTEALQMRASEYRAALLQAEADLAQVRLIDAGDTQQ